MPFLPLTLDEMKEYGWEQPDFIYVTGDAYIDHPSFGPAIITRVLENFGYKCCIVSQPQSDKDFKLFGEPRLGFLVSAGNIDSMVNHYAVSKKRRTKDYYTPNGQMGKRPDRATISYCNTLRRLYPNQAIIIGGGVSAREGFGNEINAYADYYLVDGFQDTVYIIPAQFKNDGGILGAYCNFIDRYGKGEE